MPPVPPDVKVAFCGHAGAPSPVLGFGPRIQVSPVLTSVCHQQSAAGPVCHPSLVMIGRASGGPDPARVAVQAVGWLTENTDHGPVVGRTVLRPGRTDTNKPWLLTLKSLQAGRRAAALVLPRMSFSQLPVVVGHSWFFPAWGPCFEIPHWLRRELVFLCM